MRRGKHRIRTIAARKITVVRQGNRDERDSVEDYMPGIPKLIEKEVQKVEKAFVREQRLEAFKLQFK